MRHAVDLDHDSLQTISCYLSQSKFCISVQVVEFPTISTTSSSCTFSSVFFALRPSPSIIMQNGQDTAMVSGCVSSACATRRWLTRLSCGSSIHIHPPPPPQHMPVCL